MDWSKTTIDDRVVVEGALDFTNPVPCNIIQERFRCQLMIASLTASHKQKIWLLETTSGEANHMRELDFNFNPRDVLVYDADGKSIVLNDRIRVTGTPFRDEQDSSLFGILVSRIERLSK